MSLGSVAPPTAPPTSGQAEGNGFAQLLRMRLAAGTGGVYGEAGGSARPHGRRLPRHALRVLAALLHHRGVRLLPRHQRPGARLVSAVVGPAPAVGAANTVSVGPARAVESDLG